MFQAKINNYFDDNGAIIPLEKNKEGKGMNEKLFLTTETAQKLYTMVKMLPIVDYHCHLSAKEIYDDMPFESITQMWLGGDHYKWRLMRVSGVDEKYITGQSDDFEKFKKYVEAASLAVNNPLYLWSVMELSRFFGIEDEFSAENAELIYKKANDYIKANSLSPRKCIESSNVKYIATTDDPTDSLEYHALLKGSYKTTVVPTFRTDSLTAISKPGFAEYIGRLGEAAGLKITDFSSLLQAVRARLDFFCEIGCSISDNGTEGFPSAEVDQAAADSAFCKAIKGEELTEKEIDSYFSTMMFNLAKEYFERQMTMQLHIAVKRNANTKLFKAAGADSGGDCAADAVTQQKIIAFLDNLEKNGILPQTIIYTLNPDYAALATAIGSFRNVKLGAAWWFNDHKNGIIDQLNAYSQSLNLSTFLGMLTDSRSYLSYARHDYFRRILCGFLGDGVEKGEYCYSAALKVAEKVCFENADNQFCKN